MSSKVIKSLMHAMRILHPKKGVWKTPDIAEAEYIDHIINTAEDFLTYDSTNDYSSVENCIKGEKIPPF